MVRSSSRELMMGAGISQRSPRASGWLSLLTAVLLVSGCGTSQSVDSASTAAPVKSLTTIALATTAGSGESWDLVSIGDSIAAGYGLSPGEVNTPEEAFPGIYARSLGDELGIEVELHSYFPSQTTNDIRTVAEWNEVLAADEALRSDLESAEVVMVWIGYHNVVPAFLFGSCGYEWSDELEACFKEATATMPADFDVLLGEVEALVAEDTVVMIGNQAVAPMQIERWGSEPFWPEMKAVAFDVWWDGIEATAAAHGAIMVDSAAALNGPEGDQIRDPKFVLSDKLHMSAVGQRFLADLFLVADGLGE